MPKALLLDLEHAPDSHHIVDGVPGLFHPTIPQLVGEGYPISEEAAAVYADDPGMPLKLVEVTDEEAAAAAPAVTETVAALNQAPSSTVADRAAAAEQATAAKAAKRQEKRA